MHSVRSRLLVLEAKFERLVHGRARTIEYAQVKAHDDAAQATTKSRSDAANEYDPEQSFHEALETLPAAAYTTDAAGRITFFNPSAAEFWGQSPEL